jgi:hypothetical protein
MSKKEKLRKGKYKVINWHFDTVLKVLVKQVKAIRTVRVITF